MRKSILFATVFASAVLSVSCEKAAFLDRKPYSETTPENFYSSKESQLKMALAGCYEALNASTIGSSVTVSYGTFYQGLQWILGCPSDEIVSGSTAVPYTMAQATFTESDTALEQLWTGYYHGVMRCNELIDKVEDLDVAGKVQFIAEARFMRAFYYYHMALVFGGLPIVSFPSNGDEPRSCLKDVYAYILEDFEYAAANLPETGLLHPLSANKYTAEAYIARVCNYLAACKKFGAGAEFVAEQPLNDFSPFNENELWKRSLECCKDIIANSPYVLVDKYDMLFREATKAEQYKECLFMADLPLSGSEGAWPTAARMAGPMGAGLCPQINGYVLLPNPHLFFQYDCRDVRRDHNYTCNGTGKEADGTVVRVKIGDYNYPTSTLKRTTNSTYKLLYDSDTQTFNPCSSGLGSAGKYRLVEKGVLQHTTAQHALSYPLMRLADVYLMAAEAAYFTGVDVNQCRQEYLRPVVLRAAVNDEGLCDELMEVYRRTDFVDELLESRERELCFEFSRKSDLIRFNRLDAAIAAMSPTSAVPDSWRESHPEHASKNFPPYSNIKSAITVTQTNWAPFKMWCPLSSAQMAVNQNLTQNAGW